MRINVTRYLASFIHRCKSFGNLCDEPRWARTMQTGLVCVNPIWTLVGLGYDLDYDR